MSPEWVTERLRLTPLTEADAGLVLGILTDPDFLRFVGNRGVTTLPEAEHYIAERMLTSYSQNGFGMLRLTELNTGYAVGICGLIRRNGLEHPDLGFSLLPAGRGKGYAAEASISVLLDARNRLQLDRVLAITDPENNASIHVLEKLGFELKGTTRLPDIENVLNLYQIRLDGLSAG